MCSLGQEVQCQARCCCTNLASQQPPLPNQIDGLSCHARYFPCLTPRTPPALLQVKPPICFTERQADRMVDAMASVLAALTPEDKARLAEASRAEVQAVSERHRRLG